jgi:prolipoprotein diacylglyceryltransferase
MNKLIRFWIKSPILLRTNSVIVVWFGVILGSVIALAVPTILILVYKIDQQQYIPFFYDFFTWWPIFSIAGAILFFHDNWLQAIKNFKKIFTKGEKEWRRPGAVFYGGFLGSLILACLLDTIYKVSLLYCLDFAFLIIPFYHGLSRLACLNFGCCYGKNCSAEFVLGVAYDHPSSEPVRHGIPKETKLHPAQLYEMVGCILLGITLVSLEGKVSAGRIFASYLIGYGVIRFSLEFVRDNTFEKKVYRFISIWQLLSLFFTFAGIILWLYLPNEAPLKMNVPIKNLDYGRIFLLTIWNMLAIACTFGIHFRKKDEDL